MGNQLAVVQATEVDLLLAHLPTITYKRTLGRSRFLRTFVGIHDAGEVVVKIYIKRGEANLKAYEQQLQYVIHSLPASPSLLPFRLFFETETAGFLIRQHGHMNLTDRIHIRPFLTQIEKKWIAFQLLLCLKQAHQAGVCHGDVKSENVMMTTWNWCMLADFASFKPTFLLQDNPADFSFFFDTSGRRTCNIAPERFVESDRTATGDEEAQVGTPVASDGPILDLLRQPDVDEAPNKPILTRSREMSMDMPLTPTMDIFSMGCVIAEIFLEGVSLFDLSQAVAYRKQEYNPEDAIKKIPDLHIRALVLDMLVRDPAKRKNAAQLLKDARDKAFPRYFYSFLYQFFANLAGETADVRIERVARQLPEIFAHCGIEAEKKILEDDEGVNGKIQLETRERDPIPPPDAGAEALLDWARSTTHVSDIDINHNHLDDTPKVVRVTVPTIPESAYGSKDKVYRTALYNVEIAPGRRPPSIKPLEKTSDVRVSLNKYGPTPSALVLTTAIHKHKGSDLAMFITLVCTSLRNAVEPTTKLTGLRLLFRMGSIVNDELRMQRCVPYIISMLSDDLPFIRAMALKTLTKLLELVTTVQVTDTAVFTEYILPSISRLPTDSEPLVKMTMAQCLGTIALTARRLLEFSQLIQPIGKVKDDKDDQVHGPVAFDDDLAQLQKLVLAGLVRLLNDEESTVRRAILSDISLYCQFFGVESVAREILPIIMQLTNVPNWELRRDLYHAMVPLGAYLGEAVVISRMFPVALLGLTDGSDAVVEKSASVLACWVEMKLLGPVELEKASEAIAPLLCHPLVWIRNSVIAFFGAAGRHASIATLQCHVVPSLLPFTKQDVEELTEVSLMECLKDPLSHDIYDMVLDHISVHGDLLFGSGNTPRPQRGSLRWYGHVSTETQTEYRQSPLSKGSGAEEEEKQVDASVPPASGSKVRFTTKSPTEDRTASASSRAASPVGKIRRTRAMSMKPLVVPEDQKRQVEAIKIFLLKKVNSIRSHGKMWERVQTITRMSSMIAEHRPTSASVPNRSNSPIRRPALSIGRSGSPLRHTSRSNPPEKVAKPARPTTPKPISALTVSEILWIPQQIERQMLQTYEGLSAFVGQHSLVLPDYFSPRGYQQDHANWEYSYESASTSNAGVRRTATFSVSDTPKSGDDTRTIQVKEFAVTDHDKMNAPMAALDLDAVLLLSLKNRAKDTNWSGDTKNLVNRRMLAVVPKPPPTLSSCVLPNGGSLLPRGARILSWRPTGTLVGHLAEHSGAVNALAVAPDDLFVASASDDGTVKVWDPQHVERRGAPHAKLTYSSQGGRITDLATIENTHSVACSSSNGTVHVFRVDTEIVSDKAVLSSVKTLGSGSDVLCVDHFNTDDASVIVYGTNAGVVHSWDLRARCEPWNVVVNGGLGAPTCLCTPGGGNWFAAGTGGGAIVLYDIRFMMPLKTLCLPMARVNRISLHHSATADKTALPLIWVAGRSSKHSVSMWDLESGLCKQAVVVSDGGLEEDVSTWTARETNEARLERSVRITHETRALLAHRGCPYILTGGTDRAVRFWDLRSANNSYIITGPVSESVYGASEGTALRDRRRYDKLSVGDVGLVREYGISDSSLAGGRNSSISEPSKYEKPTSNSTIAFPPVESKETPPRVVPAPSTMGHTVNASDYSIHDECVTDLCVVEQPRKLLFSASRDGVVKAFR